MFMLVFYTDFKAKNSKVKSTSKTKKVWKNSPASPVGLGSLPSLFISTEAEVQSQKQLLKKITVVTSVSLEKLMGEGLITKMSFLNISGQHNCKRGWGWRYTGFITFYTSQWKTAQSPLSWKLLDLPTSPAPGYHWEPWPVSYMLHAVQCSLECSWPCPWQSIQTTAIYSVLAISEQSITYCLLLPHYTVCSLQEADTKA